MSWVPELREHVTETLNLDYMSSEEEVNNPSVRISKTRPFSSRFHLLPFISNLFYFVDNLKFVVFIFFHNPASYLYFLLWLAGAFSSLNCVLTVEQNVWLYHSIGNRTETQPAIIQISVFSGDFTSRKFKQAIRLLLGLQQII